MFYEFFLVNLSYDRKYVHSDLGNCVWTVLFKEKYFTTEKDNSPYATSKNVITN